MTITTIAALQSALPGRLSVYNKSSLPVGNPNTYPGLVSFWTINGTSPTNGATPPSGVGEAPTNATTGAIQLWTPGSGNTIYLARFRFWGSTQNSGVILFDRLVHTSGLNATLTTPQTVNSVTVTRPDGTGTNAMAFIENYVQIGTTNTTMTVSYTNQSGTAGQVSPAFTYGLANFQVGHMVPIPLAAGDTGVRSVQSVTLAGTTGSAGNFGITIARMVAWCPIPGNTMMGPQDHFEIGLPAIQTGACLFIAGAQYAGNNPPKGELTFIEG